VEKIQAHIVNTVFKSKIFKVFQLCEAHNPLAVVYALSVQSFKHYNRLERRSCVVRVLGNGIMTRAHIAARQLCHHHPGLHDEHDGGPDWILARIPSETKRIYLCPSRSHLDDVTNI